MAPTIKIGYWDMRGYAAPMRNLLRYAGVPFEEDVYGFGEAPNYNWDSWLSVKQTLGLHFPNVPYLIDGDLKINQTQAILRYLGAKFGLRATNLVDQAHEDVIEQEIVDFRDRFVRDAYYKDYANEKELEAEFAALRKDLTASLDGLEKWIGGNLWLTGNKISYVDFTAYEFLDWYRVIAHANWTASHPKMAAYMERFEQLPQLKAFLASDEYRKRRILNPTRDHFVKH